MPDFLIVLSLFWGLMLGIVMITEMSNPLFNLAALFLVLMPLFFYKQIIAIAEGPYYLQWLFCGFFSAFLLYISAWLVKNWRMLLSKSEQRQ